MGHPRNRTIGAIKISKCNITYHIQNFQYCFARLLLKKASRLNLYTSSTPIQLCLHLHLLQLSHTKFMQENIKKSAYFSKCLQLQIPYEGENLTCAHPKNIGHPTLCGSDITKYMSSTFFIAFP